MPNQDAVAWTPTDGRPVVLAVADGHGSPRTFRSDIGARVAVTVATRLGREFMSAEGHEDLSAAELKARAEELLPGLIIEEWRAAIREDLSATPLSDAELELGNGTAGGDPEYAYGATLLVAAASDRRLLFLQVGDGDIVTVRPNGEVSQPIPPDPSLMANETTSLCSPSAEKEFRIEVFDLQETSPELVLLSTDGYSNSFVDEASFLKVGADLMAMLDEKGAAWVNENMQEWLIRASREGSGDDITLGMLWRADGAALPAGATVGTSQRPALVAETETQDKRSRKPLFALATGLAGLLVGGVLSFVLFGDQNATPTTPKAERFAWAWSRANTLLRLEERTRTSIRVPGPDTGEVVGVAAGAGSVWIAIRRGAVYRVDEDSPTEGVVGDPIPVPGRVAGIAFFGRHIWLTSEDGTKVYRFAPETPGMIEEILLQTSLNTPTVSR